MDGWCSTSSGSTAIVAFVASVRSVHVLVLLLYCSIKEFNCVASDGVLQHAIIVPLTRPDSVFTICSPMPLDAPVTTKIASGSEFRRKDASDPFLVLTSSAGDKFRSTLGNIGVPLNAGGSGASNDDDDGDDDDRVVLLDI